jgi:hypothetical protein
MCWAFFLSSFLRCPELTVLLFHLLFNRRQHSRTKEYTFLRCHYYSWDLLHLHVAGSEGKVLFKEDSEGILVLFRLLWYVTDTNMLIKVVNELIILVLINMTLWQLIQIIISIKSNSIHKKCMYEQIIILKFMFTNLHSYREIILCLRWKEDIDSLLWKWLIPCRRLSNFNDVKLW